jgi:hypothetical protein
MFASILTIVCACGPEQGTDDSSLPDEIGPQVYRVSGGYCVDACPDLRLYRDGEALQLLVFSGDGTFMQATLATLDSAPAAIIDESSSQILAGERELGTLDPACLSFFDKATVELSLLGSKSVVHFSYPQACAPTGLADIDAQYHEALTAMTQCDSGVVVSLDDLCLPT